MLILKTGKNVTSLTPARTRPTTLAKTNLQWLNVYNKARQNYPSTAPPRYQDSRKAQRESTPWPYRHTTTKQHATQRHGKSGRDLSNSDQQNWPNVVRLKEGDSYDFICENLIQGHRLVFEKFDRSQLAWVQMDQVDKKGNFEKIT
jgi:hypothetical protein